MFELVGFVAGLVSLLLEARHRMREGIQGIVVDRGLVIEQGIRGLGTGGRRGRSRVGIGQRGMAGGVFLVYNGIIARSYRHGWCIPNLLYRSGGGGGEMPDCPETANLYPGQRTVNQLSHAIPCCTDSSARLD